MQNGKIHSYQFNSIYPIPLGQVRLDLCVQFCSYNLIYNVRNYYLFAEFAEFIDNHATVTGL